MDILDKLYQKGVSRRNFLVGAGAAGAVTALAGCNDAYTAPAGYVQPTLTDNDILTFALNLEYLEAEFYLYAATGAGLAAADITAGSATSYTVGTTIVPTTTKLTGLTAFQQNFVNELAYTEQAHVRFLRSALGSAAVARPAIDLTFFQGLATAAGITGTYSPFTSYDNFLLGAFIFEDVGVSAYLGGAGLLSTAAKTNGVLGAASGILAIEAYHSAAARTFITANAIAATVITPGTTGNATATTTYAPFNNANLVAKLRLALGGGNETLLTLPTTTAAPGTAPAASVTVPAAVYASGIVNATPTAAINAPRTPDQVHHIVYGSATVGVAKGGFFPNGTNFKFSQTVS